MRVLFLCARHGKVAHSTEKHFAIRICFFRSVFSGVIRSQKKNLQKNWWSTLLFLQVVQAKLDPAVRATKNPTTVQ
jgi:hypothetical protein